MNEKSSETETEVESKGNEEEVSLLTTPLSKTKSQFSRSTKSLSKMASRVRKTVSRQDDDFAPIEIQPIVHNDSRVGFGRLIDNYYSTLNLLLPPIHNVKFGTLNEKLRQMNDAIEEIDKKLDEYNFSAYEMKPSNRQIQSCGPTRCVIPPIGVCFPKPDNGIALKAYRIRWDNHSSDDCHCGRINDDGETHAKNSSSIV